MKNFDDNIPARAFDNFQVFNITSMQDRIFHIFLHMLTIVACFVYPVCQFHWDYIKICKLWQKADGIYSCCLNENTFSISGYCRAWPVGVCIDFLYLWFNCFLCRRSSFDCYFWSLLDEAVDHEGARQREFLFFLLCTSTQDPHAPTVHIPERLQMVDITKELATLHPQALSTRCLTSFS